MKKHRVHRKQTHDRVVGTVRGGANSSSYIVVVRSWMFLVAFAMMLGLGAMLGNFINANLYQSTPQVAGASTSQ